MAAAITKVNTSEATESMDLWRQPKGHGAAGTQPCGCFYFPDSGSSGQFSPEW